MSSKIPCFTIEEHHEAFIVWAHAIRNGFIRKDNNILLHFDDHSDMNSPRLNISLNNILSQNLEEIESFVNSELSIASFIVPAAYLKIFNHVVWIKHQMQKELETDMFVRSFNNDGLKLISSKYDDLMKIKLQESDIIKYSYSKVDSISFNKYIIRKDLDHVLDIDLDYFSCADNTYFDNEVVIEVTKEQYYTFVNDKYHMLRFISGRVEGFENEEKYYLVLNYFKYQYPEPRKVDNDTILHRITEFKNQLVNNSVEPKLITICRSRYSGFTPRDQWEFIERNVLNAIQEIYSLNCLKLNDVLKPVNYEI